MCISLFLLSPSVLLKIIMGERKALMDSEGRAFSCPHSYFKKVKITVLHGFFFVFRLFFFFSFFRASAKGRYYRLNFDFACKSSCTQVIITHTLCFSQAETWQWGTLSMSCRKAHPRPQMTSSRQKSMN